MSVAKLPVSGSSPTNLEEPSEYLKKKENESDDGEVHDRSYRHREAKPSSYAPEQVA